MTHDAISPEYLAGFFDGEGCIDCQRMYAKASSTFYVRPRVRISQAVSGRAVLDRLHAVYGGTLKQRPGSNPNQQEYISWEFLDGKGMLILLKTTLPFLIVKREQAELAIWWLENATGLYSGKGIRPELSNARKLFSESLMRMKRDSSTTSADSIKAIAPMCCLQQP